MEVIYLQKGLTQKQEEFCKQYNICKNEKQAALLAGYSKKNANNIGRKLLQNEQIKRHITSLTDYKNEEVIKAYVIEKLVDLLERCLEAKPVTKWDASKKENIETGVYTFDSRGAIKALEQLAKYLGMSQEKDDNKSNVVVNIIEDIN